MDISFTMQAFWIPLFQIILVNIVLSGDNAVVIALAARSLPPQQQKKAVFWGSGAAIFMRIFLTIFAVALLKYPYLKLVGSVLLLWIGIQLLIPEDGDEEVSSSEHLMAAIKTILIADLVMSLDNVIAVAAAAKGSTLLLVIGLAVSIPLVVFGSTLLLRVIERFPVIVWLGAALLGYIAGEILAEEPVVHDQLEHVAHGIGFAHEQLAMALGVLGAVIVVGIGRTLLARHARLQAATPGGMSAG